VRGFIQHLKSNNYDIIFLQEVFILNSYISYIGNQYKSILIQECASLGYLHNAEAHKTWFPRQDSGLLILSRYPILNCQAKIFSARSWMEIMCEKGFLVAEIQFAPHETVICVNAHLDSKDQQIRMKELQEIKDYIKENYAKKRIIIAGDLNMDIHNSVMAPLRSTFKVEPYTFPTTAIAVGQNSGPFLKLDHIYSNLTLSSSSTVCINSSDNIPVSDHFALLATFFL